MQTKILFFVAGFGAAMVLAQTTSFGKKFVSGGNKYFSTI